MKACIGLAPDHNMGLEHKLPKQIFQLPTSSAEYTKLKEKSSVAAQNGLVQNGGKVPYLNGYSTLANGNGLTPVA